MVSSNDHELPAHITDGARPNKAAVTAPLGLAQVRRINYDACLLNLEMRLPGIIVSFYVEDTPSAAAGILVKDIPSSFVMTWSQLSSVRTLPTGSRVNIYDDIIEKYLADVKYDLPQCSDFLKANPTSPLHGELVSQDSRLKWFRTTHSNRRSAWVKIRNELAGVSDGNYK